MGRTKYIYNPITCGYEPYQLKGKPLRNRILIFLSLSFLLSLGAYYKYIEQYGSLEEALLEQKNGTLKAQWQFLEERIVKSQQALSELIDKDDNNYRIILDSHPLDPAIREAGAGGSEKFELHTVQQYPLIMARYMALLSLKHKLAVEVQSFKELDKILEEKIRMWASRPAIQPISNAELDRLHLTFGPRLHPIFGVVMDHKGLDFTASIGTPIYATGDGKVIAAHFSGTYGNVIYINHGHEYETRYAHLSKFAVRNGERVKRGQIIGYVGNTGNSAAPHLHYEVLYKGQQINPINFFQRDLNNKEYERLIEVGSRQNAFLD